MSVLLDIINSTDKLQELSLMGTRLFYQNHSIDIQNLNIENFLNQNPKFNENFSNMNAEDVYNIIKIHAIYANFKKEQEKEQKELSARKYIETTPLLKSFTIIKKTDNNQIEHYYTTYTDNNGLTHVLKDISYQELFQAYKEIIQSESLIKTDKDVFNILNSKYGNNTTMDSVVEYLGNESELNTGIKDEIKLIDFSTYTTIIVSSNITRKNDIKIYEAYLVDIIKYKDYLTPELYDIYQKWANFFQYLIHLDKTPMIQETLNNYVTMGKTISNVANTEEELIITRKNPDQKTTGFVSVTIYIILTIAIAALITTLVLSSS